MLWGDVDTDVPCRLQSVYFFLNSLIDILSLADVCWDIKFITS